MVILLSFCITTLELFAVTAKKDRLEWSAGISSDSSRQAVKCTIVKLDFVMTDQNPIGKHKSINNC